MALLPLISEGIGSSLPPPHGQAIKASGHIAGFDGLRLICALAVIFSHSFLIATGSENEEPFVRVLGAHNSIGLYGVFIFFSISGFLLARSLSTNPNAIRYVVNRVLRILPAFLFCILICALLIGPIFSSAGTRAYFSDSAVVDYLKSSIDNLTDMKLPGLFGYDAHLANVVNGSLWSLRYEALSYVLLLLLWTLFRASGLVAGVIIVIAALTRLSPSVNSAIAGIAYTLPYFATGVLMNWIHARFGTHRLGVLIVATVLLVSCFFGWQLLAFAPFGAYLIVYLGECRNPFSRLTNRIGDCSYGLYLFGWPVEQIVKQLTGTTNPWRLMIIALPFACLLAFISCNVIEKPAIGLKRVAEAFLSRGFRWAVSWFGNVGSAAAWGARVSFVIGAAFILISEKRWSYFFEAMSQVLLGVVAGSFIAVVIYRALASGGKRTV
jgi:peptidoglycan/LPS O-acetylase OafA/YrhL